MSGLEPFRPSRQRPFDQAAAAHLLRRAGFGAPAAEVERAVREGLAATLERLLAGAGHDPTLLASVEPLLGTNDIWSVQAWWLALILANADPLRERMTLLWHDHFATSNDKVRSPRAMYRQSVLLRKHALGNFAELLHEIVRDPAMIVWLDGDQNVQGRPNENLARELFELFALGIGNYTESDVKEAARALTGLGTRGGQTRFRAGRHDRGGKSILGRRGPFGPEDLVDIVLAQPACSRHVARRLLEEFVGPRFSSTEVEEVAGVLRGSGWDLARAVECILGSELFFDPTLRRGKICSPVELVAGATLAVGAQVTPRRAAQAAARMGQSLFRPPSVKGWDGGRSWIGTGTWIARHDFVVDLAFAEVSDCDLGARVHLESLVDENLGTPAAAGALVAALFPGDAPPAVCSAAVESARRAPDRPHALARAAALAMTAPEFHLS